MIYVCYPVIHTKFSHKSPRCEMIIKIYEAHGMMDEAPDSNCT
jgi:hypothetical protein